MHPNSQHMMAVANSFWPFSYPLKSYDMALHPAFLQTAYRGVPTIPYGQQFESAAQTQQQQRPQPSSPSPPQKSSAKFSIDAILNRDKVKDVPNRDINSLSEPTNFTNFVKYAKDDDDVVKRRHQRLLEASHPYLSHHSSLQEKTFLQKHLQTTYKHYTDAVRSPDKDKKTSPCVESWSSKSSKGKRVRTIFTPEQLERMEAEFERQQYMVGTERYYLASSLNLTEAQVKVWFQNRRIKWRKQHLEQQQAKLKSLNIYRQAETASDSESEDDVTSGNRDLVPEGDLITERDLISADRDRMTERDLIGERSHDSIADPFHSPKEARCTQ